MGVRSLVAASCAALMLPIPAQAEMDVAVRQALALHGGGRAAEAFAMLAPLEQARAGDVDFDYALGIAAADSGHLGVAVRALQRVIAVQPQNAQARAEIARVYALTGDAESASAAFDTVVDDPSVPDPVRQRINGLIRSLDRTAAGRDRAVSAFIDVESGYDSNVNTATAATTLTLPAFAFLGPATLGGGASRVDAAVVQGQAGLSAEAGLSRRMGIYGSVLGLWRDASDGQRFDQAALTGTAGLTRKDASGGTASLSGQVQQFWLAHDSFRTSYAAIAQYTGRLSPTRALSGAVQYTWLDYRGDPLRNADRYSAQASFTGRTALVSAGGGTERPRRAAARHLGYDFATLTAAAELPLGRRVAVTGSAAIEYRGYRADDPLFLARRHDWQADASVGLRVALTNRLSVRPRATYTRNASNFALYDYDRVTAVVGLRLEM